MRNRRKFRLLRAALLLIMLVCLIPVGQAYYLSYRHEVQQKGLKNSLANPKIELQKEENTKATEDMLEKFGELYIQNNDLVGWLSIEGTKIDYPVLRCEEDDDYYLTRNFQREKDKYGSLFVKGIADVDTPGRNFIIYGHNMRDGSMFGTLDRYESKEFCKEHDKIYFDTLYEERVYEIMAVFQVQLYQEDQTFEYYEFYQAETEKEFLEFYENVKKIALYDTGVSAEFGDTLLTLSTCSNVGEDGRLVVVAKRVEKGSF